MTWIKSVIAAWGYPGVALAVFLECIYPPIPSEVILPFAGFVVAQGLLSFTGSVLSATVGSVLSALVYYYVGWFVSKEMILEFVRKHQRWFPVSEANVELAFSWFQKKGGLAVFTGRIIPTVRELISIPAGVTRMPVWTYTAYTAAGSAIWNSALIGAGVVLGSQWQTFQVWFDRYQYLALLAIAGLIGLALLLRTFYPVLKRSVTEILSGPDRREKIASLTRQPAFVNIAVAVFLALAFALVANSVQENEFWTLDLSLAQRIFHLQSPVMVWLTRWASLLMSPLTILAIMGAIALWTGRARFKRLSLLTVALGGSLISNNILKLIFRRPRPFLAGAPLDTGFSFPSSHAAVATAFYGVLIYLLMHTVSSKPLRFAAVILGIQAIVVIGVSRVHLGVHYPSDVIGGTLIGMLWAVLAVEAMRFAEGRLSNS